MQVNMSHYCLPDARQHFVMDNGRVLELREMEQCARTARQDESLCTCYTLLNVTLIVRVRLLRTWTVAACCLHERLPAVSLHVIANSS